MKRRRLDDGARFLEGVHEHNFRGAEAGSFAATAVLDDGSLAPVEPASFEARAGQTVQLTVAVRVPFDARPGSQRELMLTVSDSRTGGYNSASQQIETRDR